VFAENRADETIEICPHMTIGDIFTKTGTSYTANYPELDEIWCRCHGACYTAVCPRTLEPARALLISVRRDFRAGDLSWLGPAKSQL